MNTIYEEEMSTFESNNIATVLDYYFVTERAISYLLPYYAETCDSDMYFYYHIEVEIPAKYREIEEEICENIAYEHCKGNPIHEGFDKIEPI